MIFHPLASSSHGNAYLVDDGKSVLLLECGVSYRKLGKLVREAGYRLSGLSGCLITHEHKDHAACWDKLADSGVPVYASGGTIDALGADGRILPITPDTGAYTSQPMQIGTFRVVSFRTFHDAAEPVGFLILSDVDGDKLAFATDTGNLAYTFPHLDYLAIEANFEEERLAKCRFLPPATAKRIYHTHMEIRRLCAYLDSLDLSQCRAVYLMHLSDASSDENLFADLVCRVVPERCKVIVCPKEAI